MRIEVEVFLSLPICSIVESRINVCYKEIVQDLFFILLFSIFIFISIFLSISYVSYKASIYFVQEAPVYICLTCGTSQTC